MKHKIVTVKVPAQVRDEVRIIAAAQSSATGETVTMQEIFSQMVTEWKTRRNIAVIEVNQDGVPVITPKVTK